MTVYIFHAQEDAEAARSLERFLERRGLFAETQDASATALALQGSDAAVVLWSRRALASPARLAMEARALDAWAEGRLGLVTLDQGVLPVGLRDLPGIDARLEGQRDIAWAAVARAVQGPGALVGLKRPESAGRAATGALGERCSAQPAAAAGDGKARSALGLWSAGGLIAAAAGVAAALGAWWLLGLTLAAAAVLVWLWAAAGFKAGEEPGRRARPRFASGDLDLRPDPLRAETPVWDGRDRQPGGLFVSYALADSAVVIPLVAGVKGEGGLLWSDQEGLQAEQGPCGRGADAILQAQRVVVMCSASAFGCDRVKRETFLAFRFGRPVAAVFLEEAAPPEEFAALLAQAPPLALFALPEEERVAALARALRDR